MKIWIFYILFHEDLVIELLRWWQVLTDKTVIRVEWNVIFLYLSFSNRINVGMVEAMHLNQYCDIKQTSPHKIVLYILCLDGDYMGSFHHFYLPLLGLLAGLPGGVFFLLLRVQVLFYIFVNTHRIRNPGLFWRTAILHIYLGGDAQTEM